MTTPPQAIPGELRDATTGLHTWNDWYVLPGHQTTEDMHRAIRSQYKALVIPDAWLSPAYHEHARIGPYGWELGGTIPVTLVVLQRPIDDEEEQP